MGRNSHQDGEPKVKRMKLNGNSAKPFQVEEAAIDPTVAQLFASSAGPVQAPPKSRYDQVPPARNSTQARRIQLSKFEESLGAEEPSQVEADEEEEENDADLTSVEGDLEDAQALGLLEEDSQPEEDPSKSISALVERKQERKRKRQAGADGDDLEGQYMLKLAKEEEKEEAERKAERKLKRQRSMAEQDPDMSEENEDLEGDSDDDDSMEGIDSASKTEALLDIPLHETLQPDKESTELEKAARTVFLANVSTSCITDKKAKKTLLDHMGSFLGSLPAPKAGQPAHKVESLRFRSTAYAGNSLPKKASFATKNLMDATTKSTNAYVVYNTAFAAREAVKHLNATMVLDRHLRVDGVAHPAKTDHRRCVFVGNLGFVDDESLMDQGGEGERKRSKMPSDIEEGLWRQFGKAGKVESVRVVRDEKTRVGKGFAYVQFEDGNSVEAALLFNEKKYPPMLPRVLRVTRAKAINKTALASQRARPGQKPQQKGAGNANKVAIYNPKLSGQQQSLQGRASKLLGKAGAAQFKKFDGGENRDKKPKAGMEGIGKTPESIVYEGYRASAKSGKPKDLKFGKGGKKSQGKPQNRGAKRATAWKKGGAKKSK